MSIANNGNHPAFKLASEGFGKVVDWAKNFAASDRELTNALNEPKLAVLSERRRFLLEKRQGLLKEIAPLQGSGRSGSVLAQIGYLTVATLLATVGYVLADMTLRPFDLGPMRTWLSVGLAVVLVFAIHRFLEHFRSHWVHRVVLVAALLSAFAAMISFAEVRSDVMTHLLYADAAAVVLDDGREGGPPPSGGDEQRVFVLLRRAVIFAALAFELAAGLAFFAFCEARRNSDLGRLTRLNKDLLQTENELLKVIEEMHELLAQPQRQDGEFWREFHRAVMDCIGNGGRRLGAIVIATFLAASSLQAEEKLRLVLGLDLSLTSAVNYSGRSELERNREAIAALLARLPPGASVTVIGITDQTYVNPHILLSAELASDTGYFGSRLNAGRRRLLSEWQKRSGSLTASFKATDVLGAMRYAGETLSGGDGRKGLAIFSDGRHYTAELDLESPQVIPVAGALRRLKKQGLQCSLAGVEVFLFGVGDHTGKRGTGYTLGLKDFWAAYIKEAGGTLRVFSTTREPGGLGLLTAGSDGRTSP